VQQVHHAHRAPGHQVGADLGVAQLVLGLRLEDRILEADRHRAQDALAHVVAVVLALGELVDGLEHALAEGAQVRAAVVRELAVDEGVVLLAEAVGVGEGEFRASCRGNAAADRASRTRFPRRSGPAGRPRKRYVWPL
jgi:ABC-type thiamine transport system ATPase subunit